MRLSFLLALTAGSLVGCTPHDAELTSGSYLAYFAADSSQNILAAQGRGVDLTTDTAREKYGFVPVDCRPSPDYDVYRLAGVDYGSECVDDAGDPYEPYWWLWSTQYAYYLREETNVQPYRIEVVQTSEGDIQFTAHVDAGKLGDFRFGWVIDPVFQPTDCVDTADGTSSELVDVDGDWVTNWSAGAADGGTLYHLNAYAYQVNPSAGSSTWSFDPTWQAGYAFGRFGEEELYGHQIDYADPYLTNDNPYGRPLYYLTYNQQFTASPIIDSSRYNNYTNWAEKWQSNFDEGQYNDLNAIGKAETVLQMRVENNAWRINEADPQEVKNESTSNYAYGLEYWTGVDPTWVHFDATPEEIRALQAGDLDKPLTGTFQLFIEPVSSASKVFVQGSFEITHIRKDTWGYKRTLEEITRDENDTPKCGDDRLTIEE